MLAFSPMVIRMRRWVYSIWCPPFLHDSRTGRNIQHDITALLGQSVNRYTAGSLVMKMSTMPIVYVLIRLCEESPGKSYHQKVCK